MQIYTWNEFAVMRDRGVNLFGLCTVLLLAAVVIGCREPGWMVPCFTLAAVMAGILVYFPLRAVELRAFGPAFIVDTEQNVLGYYPEGGYVRKKELKGVEGEIISHILQPVERQKQLQVVVDGLIVTIRVKATMVADPNAMQNYFDCFAKQSGKMLNREQVLDNLLATFLRQEEAKITTLCGEEKVSDEAAYVLGIRLSTYLGGELASSGVRRRGSICEVSKSISLLS